MVKCINKILVPTEGRVTINGTDVRDMKQKEIAKLVGYVPTHSEDAFSMPVTDAILVGRYSHGHRGTRDEDLQAVYRVMKLLHIRSLADRGFKELSAGQHQKVSLARGLVQETPVLLLDEPTSNLDIKFQIYVAELLRGLAESEGTIILMISHDINIAAKYAHNIILMSKPGCIYAMGAPEETVTRENMKEVFDIDCEVVDIGGYPHVLPGLSVMNEDEPCCSEEKVPLRVRIGHILGR